MGWGRETRLPTEKQRKVTTALKPFVGDDVLPYGIFAKVAREAGCTPGYVTLIWHKMNRTSVQHSNTRMVQEMS